MLNIEVFLNIVIIELFLFVLTYALKKLEPTIALSVFDKYTHSD